MEAFHYPTRLGRCLRQRLLFISPQKPRQTAQTRAKIFVSPAEDFAGIPIAIRPEIRYNKPNKMKYGGSCNEVLSRTGCNYHSTCA